MNNFVNVIDHMGSDLTVVNSARISFKTTSTCHVDGVFQKNYRIVVGEGEALAFGDAGRRKEQDKVLKDKDKKLIKYLAEHGHWSPFAHAFVTFHIKSPFFVARQLAKHQVGFSWNEVSRRYVTIEPEFYFPPYFRKSADNIKQGSSKEPIESPDSVRWMFNDTIRHCKDTYNALLKAGVCAEQARAVLPLATYTEWYWSGSLQGWSRICKQRLAEDTQEETRLIVKSIDEHMGKLFPVSWKELMK